jgi:hypothetical protein
MSMVPDHHSDFMAGLVTRKSDVSDLRSRLIKRKSGTPDFRAIHDLRLSAKKDMDLHDVSREDGASRPLRRHDAGRMSAGTTTARAC